MERRLLFSAKESFYKACFQLRPDYVDFLDVAMEINVARREFFVTPLERSLRAVLGAHSVCGRFARVSGLICTAAAIGVRAGAVAPDRLEQSLRPGLAAGSLGREQTVNSIDLHVVESK